MKAIVLYHSLFGNTKKVAISLADGISQTGIEAICKSIDEIDIGTLKDYDLIAIGGPTHIINLSKEMKAFMQSLKSVDISGRFGFAFDTRNESRMNQRKYLFFENSAARRIEGALKRMKVRIIQDRISAIVEGREGPLDSGVEKLFLQIGREIGELLHTPLIQK
jgi:flavodoxin